MNQLSDSKLWCLCIVVVAVAAPAAGVQNVSLDEARQIATFHAHGDTVRAVAFHPDGTRLFSGGNDGQLVCWSLQTLAEAAKRDSESKVEILAASKLELDRKPVSDQVVSLDFDRSGNTFAASGVTRWGNGFGSGLKIFTPYQKEPFGVGAEAAWSYTSVAVHPTGEFVAMGAINNELKVVSLRPKQLGKDKIGPNMIAKTAPAVPGPVLSVAFHPKELLVVGAGEGGWIRQYKVSDDGLELQRTPQNPSHKEASRVVGLRYTPSGKHLVSVADDKMLKVIEADTGGVLISWQPSEAIPLTLSLHPEYPLAAVGYADQRVRVVDYFQAKTIAELKCHEGTVTAVAFSPNGSFLATGGEDQFITLWDLGVEPSRQARRRRR